MNLSTKSKIRLASLAFRLIASSRSLRGKTLTGQFRRQSLLWELDLREVVDFMIYLSGGFEKGLGRFISKNVRPGDIVFDIGANIGAHTLPLGCAVGATGMVYAIEATDYAWKKLCRNIELNPSIRSRIKPLHCLLTSEEGVAPVSVCSSWPFHSEEERHPSHQGIGKSVGSASHLSLDALVEAYEIERIELIKIDVDGNEWDVFSGANETIQQLQPLIIMELAPSYYREDCDGSFSNLYSLLHSHGYRFYDFNGNALPEGAGNVAASIPSGASRNVVLVPHGKALPRFL